MYQKPWLSNIAGILLTELPNIIVMGDFKLPSINWLDGNGQLTSNSSFGIELNNLFLDQINDIGFDQFVSTLTRITTYF